MVQLTRLNQEIFLLNSDLIEQVDITPDTVITLTNSHKLLVLESADEVVRLVKQFRQSIYQDSALKELGQTGGARR